MSQPFHQGDSKSPGLAAVLKEMLLSLPSMVSEVVKSKTAGIAASSRLREEKIHLDWNEASARTVYTEVEDLLKRSSQGRRLDEPLGLIVDAKDGLTPEDQRVIEEIEESVRMNNISNITRTEAYLKCYQAYPELQWSFLAHMVSRNAGWNMSDLRGGQMYPLLDETGKEVTYRFLERCNALIFQDAYPQLMLYMKSREIGSSLFYLLPHFHVSRFMRPFWDRFWLERGSALLAVGLIINEQNYIEKRVVRNPYFQNRVTEKANFHLHNWAGLNQIIFPLLDLDSVSAEDGTPKQQEKQTLDASSCPEGHIPRLAGRILGDFSSLSTRITFGKNLYALLFGLASLRKGAEAFASLVPHTGSRADYWPALFTTDKDQALGPGLEGMELLEQTSLPEGRRLYAPKLLDAWGDTSYEPISREDWLQDHSALDGLSKPQQPYLCDISFEHRLGIIKTAFAHDTASGTDH
ncbi:DUF2515 family protein [Paenibacillus sp. J22TS3]|uniref:DUF2515 family protein n=1 Tax=Paenibacillus sp. J22TS3 TaxID=2807192 RepID=UPI001B0C67B3|nr:DUF2515 family protein [Paenibacillus sp. J22TS3]GIP24020.1 hypothetical protein J22TS3_42950 [Paenibacillus sp. J22TS3]